MISWVNSSLLKKKHAPHLIVEVALVMFSPCREDVTITILYNVFRSSSKFKPCLIILSQVDFTEENTSLLHFLTNICAIVGGLSGIHL